MNKRLAKLKNIQEANILFTKRNLKENEFSLDDLFSKKIQSNMDEDDEFNDNEFPMDEFNDDEFNDNEFPMEEDDEFNDNEFPMDEDDEFNDNEFPMEEDDEFSTYGDDEFSRYGDDEFNDRENPKSVHDSDMNESSSKRKCLSCGKKR
jgi:hypothetical protein